MSQFGSTIVVKVHGLQITELAEVRKEQVTPFRDLLSDGSIEHNDLRMLRLVLGSKVL